MSKARNEKKNKGSFSETKLPRGIHPNARNLFNGVEVFCDREILEFLIHQNSETGDANALSHQLIEHYGTLAAVVSAPTKNLYKFPELSEFSIVVLKLIQEAAIRIVKSEVAKRSIFPISSGLIQYLRVIFSDQKIEKSIVIYLNKNYLMISCELHSTGTIDRTALYPREIMKRGIELGASGFIVVHNHPDGNASPSEDDVVLSRDMQQAMKFFSLNLLDHIIITDSSWLSMKALGYII